LINFGVDGVNVFQGIESNVMKHIHDDYAPYSIIVHCMTHRTNLVMAFKIHEIGLNDGNQGEQNLA
jgi:hypothetical protein